MKRNSTKKPVRDLSELREVLSWVYGGTKSCMDCLHETRGVRCPTRGEVGAIVVALRNLGLTPEDVDQAVGASGKGEHGDATSLKNTAIGVCISQNDFIGVVENMIKPGTSNK
jgi:hypothetical protein